TMYPNQLPTTPTAQYELVNISGKNSSLSPNTAPCTTEQYATSGTLTAIYSVLNRSRKNLLFLPAPGAGASRSNTMSVSTSQKMVYTVLTGNSAVVYSSGKSETCPATANGLNAEKCRRS